MSLCAQNFRYRLLNQHGAGLILSCACLPYSGGHSAYNFLTACVDTTGLW